MSRTSVGSSPTHPARVPSTLCIVLEGGTDDRHGASAELGQALLRGDRGYGATPGTKGVDSAPAGRAQP